MTGPQSTKDLVAGSISSRCRLQCGRSLGEKGLTGPCVRDDAQYGALLRRVSGGNGQRGAMVRAPNRNPGGSLGGLHERVETGRGAWWGTTRQAEVGENLADHRGVFDRGEDGQRATALWAGRDVDGEDAFE